MKKQILSLFIILTITLTGCSSVRKSISFGAVTGAISGMVLANGNAQKVQTGLAIGALVGGITSYFIHEGLEKRDASTRKETLFNLDRFGVFGQVKTSNSRSQSAPYSLSPVLDITNFNSML
jgi:uncharacterized protein YcfJ